MYFEFLENCENQNCENQNFEFMERYNEAYEVALKYLAVCPRSEKEVVERLYKKGYHKNEVENAVERAKVYHYIDDDEYVKAFVESYKKKIGAKKMLYKLTTEKGVDALLAQNALHDLFSDEEETDVALKIAEKYTKQKKIKPCDNGKVGSYLYQKGYSSTVISKVIGLLFEEGAFESSYED